MAHLSYRSIAALTALKALIKTGAYGDCLRGADYNAARAAAQLVENVYAIADAMDAEGKKRHAEEQKGKQP